MIHPQTLRAFREELTKTALLERLVRLGATDIPGTPRLVMRKRSPAELGQLQQSVDQWWGNKVTKPIAGFAEKGVQKLPSKVQPAARGISRAVAEDPVGTLASTLSPIPGTTVAYHAGKKGMEKLIDRVAPVPLG